MMLYIALGLFWLCSAFSEKYRDAGVVVLFILTIMMAVSMHNYLHMPPVIGMMTGLGFLKLFGYYLKLSKHENMPHGPVEDSALGSEAVHEHVSSSPAHSYDIFTNLQKAEWDTLMFFYGVILYQVLPG